MTDTETVIKKDLARQLSNEFDQIRLAWDPATGVSGRKVVKALLDCMADHLEDGRRIELRGFGVFETVDRDPRPARDPRTGEPIQVPAKVRPRWRPGRPLREAVEDANEPTDTD